MSQIHTFICDSCKTQAVGTWNGEHWLPPADWSKFVDRDIRLRSPSQDFCWQCTHIASMNNLKQLAKLKEQYDKPKKKKR